MSLTAYIDGIPVYSTIAEAEKWAAQYGLTGYHTHVVLGQINYMGGTSHIQITQAINLLNPSTTIIGNGSSSGNTSGSSSGY